MVNAVAFHPLYSVLASASDDFTIKIWDWETGELERTLKAHTKRVTDCQFDSKGKQLGASHPCSIPHFCRSTGSSCIFAATVNALMWPIQ